MDTSTEIDALVGALLAAKPHFDPIIKSVPGYANRYTYAPFEKVLDAITPALEAQGITLIQGAEPGPHGELLVTTRLAHTSGQWVEIAVPMGHPSDPQQIGSALTYGRRYGFCAIVGVTAEKDDDGQVGSAKAPESDNTQRKRATPPAAAEPSPKKALLESVLQTMQRIPETVAKEQKLALFREAFGVAWNGLASKSLDDIRAGHAKLQQLITERDPAPSHGPIRTSATPDQIEGLRALARRLGEAVYADLQDTLEHHQGRLDLTVYERIRERLLSREAERQPPTAGQGVKR